MSEYILDLTKCNGAALVYFTQIGLLKVPLNKGLHYYDWDVAEEDIDQPTLKLLRELNESATMLDPTSHDEQLIACRETLPMGFDTDGIPWGAIIVKA